MPRPRKPQKSSESPQKVSGCSRRPQEAQGSSRKPQEAPGGPRAPQDTPRHSRRHPKGPRKPQFKAKKEKELYDVCSRVGFNGMSLATRSCLRKHSKSLVKLRCRRQEDRQVVQAGVEAPARKTAAAAAAAEPQLEPRQNVTVDNFFFFRKFNLLK